MDKRYVCGYGGNREWMIYVNVGSCHLLAVNFSFLEPMRGESRETMKCEKIQSAIFQYSLWTSLVIWMAHGKCN
jgi:hypothetical protein